MTEQTVEGRAGSGSRVRRKRVRRAKSALKFMSTWKCSIQQRNACINALDAFAHENNVKPRSIKMACERIQATDKDKSSMIDYTEVCKRFRCSTSGRR